MEMAHVGQAVQGAMLAPDMGMPPQPHGHEYDWMHSGPGFDFEHAQHIQQQ